MSDVEIDGLFISFPVVSVSQDAKTNEKIIDRFVIWVIAEGVAGVNDIDSEEKKIDSAVQSVVYFKPDTGMKPILSSSPSKAVRTVVNKVRGMA